jgi:hypothetical protein
MHLPLVPLYTFVLEPKVQVGAEPINQASRLDGHAHH